MKEEYLNLLKNQINAKSSVNNLSLYCRLRGFTPEEFEKYVSPDRTDFCTEDYLRLKEDFTKCIVQAMHTDQVKNDIYLPIKYLFRKWVNEKQLYVSEEILWKNTKTSLDIILDSSIEIAQQYFDSYEKEKQSFYNWMLSDGYQSLIEEYPVLLTQISAALHEYIELIQECLCRIQIHKTELLEVLGINVDEEIVDINCAVSDRHYQGKSVVIITYRSHKLVYKPRNMSVDVFWLKIAEWLSNKDNRIKIRASKIVCGDDYGFAEWIEADAELPESEIAEYSYRSGNLLGMVSLLGGTDFHFENVICSNATPVLVDVETLILPCIRQIYSTDQDYLRLDVFFRTQFMRTFLLPTWVGNRPEVAVDIGGFSAVRENGSNIPKHENGVFFEFGEYPDLFIKGFEDVLNFVLHHKEEYLSVIEDIKHLNFRYILRNTRVYYKLIKYFSNPIYLKDNHIFGCAVSRVFAPYLLICNSDITEKMWPIAEVEYNELYKYHIPIFGVQGDSTDLLGPDNEIILKDFFYIDPYNYVRQTIDWLDERSICKYRQYLENVIAIHNIQKSDKYNWQISYFDINRKWLSVDNGFNLFNYCNRILHNIHSSIENKALNEELQLYFAPVKDSLTGRYSMEIMKDALYGGRYGVQIFQEMYYHYFGCQKERERLENQVYIMAKEFHENKRELKWFSMSLTNGVAGLLLLLRNFALISGNTSFNELLFEIIHSIPQENIIRCDESDYYNGIAGLLYIICSSFKCLNQSITKENQKMIEFLVLQLFERRSEDGLWFQEEFYYQPLTGLGHGQSGYVLALAEAIPFLEEKLRNQVEKQIAYCIQYEEDCFDKTEINLPDYRKLLKKRNHEAREKRRKFMYGYCSGILGSSLVVNHLPENLVCCERKEWWRLNSEKYMKRSVLIGNDSLCCGTAGWIDYLSSCHKGENWSEGLFEKLIYSVNEQGYVLNGLINVEEISLYKGVSGIGYAILRYLGDYPSVLL